MPAASRTMTPPARHVGTYSWVPLSVHERWQREADARGVPLERLIARAMTFVAADDLFGAVLD